MKKFQAACQHFWGHTNGGDTAVTELRKALAKATPKQLDELEDWIPTTTGTVGEKCDRVRRMVTRLAKEK